MSDGASSSRTSTGPSPICSTSSSGSSPTFARPARLLATARPELLEARPAWGAGKRNATVLWLDPLPSDGRRRSCSTKCSRRHCRTICAIRRRAGRRQPVLPRRARRRARRQRCARPVRRTAGWSAAPTPASRCRTPCTRCSRRGSTASLALEKAALQAGAVVGRVFWSTPVVHLLDGAEPDFGLLEERDLVAERRTTAGDDREFVIKHALTREVAYGSIPKARRGRLHASFAGWLERDSGGADERAPLLAYHYSEAANPHEADLVWAGDPDGLATVRERAVHWLSRAGRLARGRHEMEEAVELFTRAVELTDDAYEQATLWRAVGEAHALRYDGEGMRVALLRAVDGPLSDSEKADTYAFLAFQSSIRSAMWSIRLNMELIEDWAAKALELAPDGIRGGGTRAARAGQRHSQGRVGRHPARGERARRRARRASSFARSRSGRGRRRRSIVAASTRPRRRATSGSRSSSEIDDPDHLCEAYEAAAPAVAAVCRFDEARRLAELHAELSQRLSPHHRVHSVSLDLELADTLGDWHGLAAQTDRALAAIEANLTTPCVRNPRDLLLCSVAHFCIGDESRASELERDSSRLAGEGHETYLSGPRIRIALLRGDRSAMESLVELPVERALVWGPGIFAARMDALVALGRHDRIESEAPELVQAGTTVEPFALRALGAARRDDELLARADELFVDARPRVASRPDGAPARRRLVEEPRRGARGARARARSDGRAARRTGRRLPRTASRRRSST